MFKENENKDEKKDITLRGVNRELYDRFSEHRTAGGVSAGNAFSELVNIHLRQPWMLHGFRRFGRKPRSGILPEKISDLDELNVTKKDLTSAGEKTMFLFRNIKKLSFDVDVDALTLVQHVKLISKSSSVVFKGDIPKLVKLGLIRKRHQYQHPQNKEDLKDITIRNVSIKIYDEFVSKAKAEGATTGEYFSRLLAHLVPFPELQEVFHSIGDREVLFVSNEEELHITKRDLEVLGERLVIFYKAKKLTFSKDVDQELFLKNVFKIINCSEVNLSAAIPRLIVLSRVKNCQKMNIS